MSKPKREKVKMGRPPIDGVARSEIVLIRITPRERATWTKKAKAEGMALGPWIVKPLRDEAREGGK